jgi:hypothetical protein
MRRAWRTVPALVLLAGCAGVDPVEAYRTAARGLRFRLEAVHPRLDLRFPLDRSVLVLAIDLGVENPSRLRLAARRLGGAIHLEAAEGSFPIGQVEFPAGVALEPAARQTVRAELRLPYGEVQRAWKALESVALKGGAGTWKLEGRAALDLFGVPFELPLRTRLRTGPATP